MSGNCEAARRRGEQPVTRRSVRNESEPHLMSLVSYYTHGAEPLTTGRRLLGPGKANPVKNGRGLNDRLSGQHRGGVSEGGMFVQMVALREEISAGGRHCPTTSASNKHCKARSACGEVGEAHSSDEGGNDAGAKGPRLVNANSEGVDR